MGTTPIYALPYPELSEQADVPADMKQLAEKVDETLNVIARRSWAGHAAIPISVSSVGSTAVTFPVGRFTTAPAVTATADITTWALVSVASITTAGFTVACRHYQGDVSTGTITVRIIAREEG